MSYPQQYNFFMPPEWDPHECGWMQWPHEFKDKKSYKEIASWSHVDFEKGCIRAETIGFDDFISNNGEKGAKEAGRLRSEGKDYIVKDGDVLHFLFNN